SNDHLRAPVRASKARTSPLAGAGLLLSATAEPVMTRSLTTTGGDVTSYAVNSIGGTRRPDRKSMEPLAPKPAHGFPVPASSAKRRASIVAAKMRRAHEAVARPFGSRQNATPRLVKSP